MIITKVKKMEKILSSLEGTTSVYLFGCNSCAEQCRTGGKAELDSMASLLKDSGFDVPGVSLVDETCYNQLVRKEFRQKKSIRKSDAIVVLACGAGVKIVAENSDGAQLVVPALDTLFLASVDRHGRFFEGCSLCGECVLGETAGICPHTQCPKALLNGPCGGAAEGMCEVNPECECAWLRIYTKLKEQKRLHLLKKISPPKDHSGSTQPRKVLLR
jgi:hypothetical protein